MVLLERVTSIKRSEIERFVAVQHGQFVDYSDQFDLSIKHLFVGS